MKKTKEQKAITLIALIITIVVLLILAAVAITAITEYNIIENANTAVQKYGNQAEKEDEILGGYSSEIDKSLGGTSGGTGTIGTATVGNKVQSNSTINGEAYSSTNPIIPAGFKAIDTITAIWDKENLAANVKNGLVISDEAGNEFVWIPVEEITEMVKETSGVDANQRTNYESVLYDFTSTSATEKSDYGQDTTTFREPANIKTSGYEDKADRFTTITWNKNFYQESFNKMVESVAKYKGFYVGRYEMSLDASGKAQSKAGATSATAAEDSANNWWGLYEKALTYSNSGVVSEMLWGCQYDAMLRWMQENNIDVTSKTPTDTARNKTASLNETRVTGSDGSNDILNNVYDLLGNSWEWTQEVGYAYGRVGRGGNYKSNYYPSIRFGSYPTSVDSYNGSRFTLYVK